ncbi:MAG: HAMP domain-containing sensor histidine kinase [Xenococcaceae cyanobacterium MO_188.B19]|nr:HAMP domain-containing sensor histidine kinase [Xenococcaceae cyanobacterium MO_188.B19]
MSNGSGLTLHISQKSSKIANLNLLIITNDSSEIETILAALTAAKIDFTYDSAAISKFQLLLEKDYDAVIYSYKIQKSYAIESPIAQLECWQSLSRALPLILVTDPLGDRIAVECIRYGIDGYVLRNNIEELPQVLAQSLDNSSSLLSNENFRYLKHLEAVNKKLQQENNQLQAFKSKIEDYISDLIHELRNPIAAILGFSRMLQDEIYGSLNQKQMQYVSATFTTGEHLLELVNNYLDLAKINANKQQLQIERISVEDICQAAIAMLKGKAKKKGLELILDFKENIDFCYADHLRLKQVLVNLLSNAIKFTKKGSVTLKVTTTENQINFAVIDTGIGISEADCQKLFQPFEQIQTLLHRKSKGTGLGLALSRKLVELHGGKITLRSKIGEGTCFTVSLPH